MYLTVLMKLVGGLCCVLVCCMGSVQCSEESNDPEVVVAEFNMNSPKLHIRNDLSDLLNVEWYKFGTMILTFRIGTHTEARFMNGFSDTKYDFNTGDYSLTVRDMQSEDETQHYCLSTLNNQSVYGRYYIFELVARPSQVNIDPDSIMIVEAHSREISCTVPSVYPEDSLEFSIKSGSATLHNGETVNYSIREDGTYKAVYKKSVTFRKEHHRQQFYCEVSYTGPGAPATKMSSTIDISILYCDMLNITGQSSGVKIVGDRVTIMCDTDCNPPPHIKLFRGPENVIDQSPASTRLTKSNYVLSKEDNDIPFYCDIDGTSGLTSRNIEYHVNFDATSVQITQEPPDLVDEGTSTDIVCLTDEGEPLPGVSWSLSNGFTVEEEESVNVEGVDGLYRAQKTESTFTISPNRQHNGVVATCRLDGTAHTDGATLNVKFGPNEMHISAVPEGPVIIGRNITFTCVTGTLNPLTVDTAIKWKRGNSVNSDDVEFMSNDRSDNSGAYGGRTVTGTYAFVVVKDHNGKYVSCFPYWDSTDLTNVYGSQQLTVYYPHDVEIHGCGTQAESARDEGTLCDLECRAANGNPATIDTYQWFFKRRNFAEFSMLPDTGDTLNVGSLSYMKAGEYRCIARNAGGEGEAEDSVEVNYTPEGVGTVNNTETYFAALGSGVNLTLKVHSYPSARFQWSKTNVDTDAATSELENDQSRSSLVIDSVQARHYGDYLVTVTSGNTAFSRVFTVQLQQRGKPGAPREIEVASISSLAIILSFIPGLDGGYPQMITVHYREHGDAEYNQYPMETFDPPQDNRIEIRLEGQDFQTSHRYEIYLKADNNHTDGNAAQSQPPLDVTMSDAVSTRGLKIVFKGELAQLTWSEPDGYHTSLFISQRSEDGPCRVFFGVQSRATDSMNCQLHNVTNTLMIRLNTTDGALFSLQVYQGYDIIDEQRFEVSRPSSNNPPTVDVVLLAVILSIVAVAIIIGGLGLFVFMKRRRSRSKGDTDELKVNDTGVNNFENTRTASAPETSATYAVVDKSKKKKKNAGPKPEEPSATYASVDQTKKNKKGKKAKSSAPAPFTGSRPPVAPKPVDNSSPYMNAEALNAESHNYTDENPYINTPNRPQVNFEQGPYANVEFQPQQPPEVPTTENEQGGLIYADLSFNAEAPLKQDQPEVIHGQDDMVEYAAIEFNKVGPKPQESESEDDEDVNKK